MAVDGHHNITPFVNREKAGHCKRKDGFKPLLRVLASAVPNWTALLRRFVIYRDAEFRASPPSAKQPSRFKALPGNGVGCKRSYFSVPMDDKSATGADGPAIMR
eukprot:jgi/Tetstr1/420658/TSEL_011746.t1